MRTIVINSLFHGNISGAGGGLYCVGGVSRTNTVTVTNCTFSQNTASYLAGGGYANSVMYVPTTLTNCIFWGNIDNGAPGTQRAQIGEGADTTFTYCCIQGSAGGIGNIHTDPQFVDPDNDDFRIQASSPCVEAGNNSAIGEDFDLAGYPRIADGDNNGTATVDMGVYENWCDSNPGNPDNDGDGMPDYWEVYYHFDPDTYGGDDDTDGDWMKDWEEYFLWTDPHVIDTDQDTFTDREEYYIFGTNPWQFNGDEDKNGIPDVVEDGTQWGLSIDVLDLETLAQFERTNVYGYVGININTIPWYANQVFVYLDDQLLGDLWRDLDDEKQWIGLESETFTNGWHTIRIVTTDYYGITIYHSPVMVCFSNLISNVVCEDQFDPAEDYTYSGFYAGTGTLDASLVDLYGQVIWSNSYSGPNVSITIRKKR